MCCKILQYICSFTRKIFNMSVLVLNWIYHANNFSNSRFFPFRRCDFYTSVSWWDILVTLSYFPIWKYFSHIDTISTYKSIVSVALNRKFNFLFPLRFLPFRCYVYVSDLEITFSRLCICVQFQRCDFTQDKFKIRTVDCFKTHTAFMYHLENRSHCCYYTIF